MAKASITIAIGGEYQGRDAIRKAEAELKSLREAARQAGGGSADIMKLGDSFVDIGTSMTAAGQKIADFGGKLTKMTAPIAAIGAASVKLAADYEGSIAKVYTIMDKNVMSTDQMSRSILDLSTATGKSAVELSDATYQALSASVATDKVAGFVAEAARLSKAGFTETSTAVDTLTTVINAYGYSADDAAMISNRLVQTQNKGKTTVDELAASMGNVIPTASAYNVSLDNLCSAYVIMTKQGINTANATTAINGMLTELSDAGSDVAAVLKEKTGKSFGQLMADGMDLGEVIQILSDSVNGDSEAFANLWGNVRASKGALAIANAGASEFTAAMGDMASSTGLVDKALDDLATPMSKANKAINAVKNTGIQLGEELIGAAVPTLDRLAEKAQELYGWFKDLDEGTKQNIVRFGALAVAAGPVVTVFGKLVAGVGGLLTKVGSGVQTIGAFGAAMRSVQASATAAGDGAVGLGAKLAGAAEKTGLLTKATTLLKGGLAAIGIAAATAAVGLIVTKYMEWKQHTEDVRKATEGMEGALDAAAAAYAAYTPSVDSAGKSLAAMKLSTDDVLSSQAQLADRMAKTWAEVGTNAAMVDHYASEIERLGSMNRLTSDEQARLSFAVEQFNQLTGAGLEVLDAERGRLNMKRDAILQVAESYKEEARAAAAREMLQEVEKQLIKDEAALAQARGDSAAAQRALNDAEFDGTTDLGQYKAAMDAADAKVRELEASVESARKTEQMYIDIISSAPQKFSSMDAALASVGSSVSELGDLTDEQLAAMRESFDGTLQSVYDSCVTQGANIPEGLRQGIDSGADKPIQSVAQMALGAIEQAREAFKSHSPSQVMRSIGEDVDLGLKNGIDARKGEARSAMDRVAAAVKGAVTSLPASLRITGTSGGSSLAGGLSSASGSVSTAARLLGQSAEGGVSGTSRAFSSVGRDAGSSFGYGLGSRSAYYDGRNLAWTARDGMGSVSAYGAGQDFAWGFSNGLYGVDVFGAAWNIGLNALSGIKSALGIASPSKEAAKVGEWFGQGAVVGMKRTEGAIAAETGRLSDIMELSPTAHGSYAPSWAAGASWRQAPAQGNVTMNVTVNVNAGTADEGRAVGTSLADALYKELSRKGASRLWDASYSMA